MKKHKKVSNILVTKKRRDVIINRIYPKVKQKTMSDTASPPSHSLTHLTCPISPIRNYYCSVAEMLSTRGEFEIAI